MKRFLPLLAITILTGTLTAAMPQTGPVLEFDSLTKELDKVVYDGEVVDAIFRFTNKGDATLEIKGVEPSCGCTTAVPTPNKLAPGQSGSIAIKVTTTALTAATAQKTELNKTVTVISNDARNPSQVLTVKGLVAPEVSLSEPSVWFGSNPPGQAVTKEIVAEIAPDRALKLLSAASTDPQVTVSLQPVTAGNDKKIKIILSQKADAVAGMHSGEIVLKTTSRLNPEIRFFIRGLVAKSKY